MKKLSLLLAALMLLLGVQWALAAEGDGAAQAGMAMPPEGSIVHTELFATDIPTMEDFYSDLFGWTFTPQGPEYSMFDDGAGNTGGLTTEPGPMGGEPGRMTTLIYLWCPDIPAKLAEIEAHGGMTGLGVTPIPGFGSFAIFMDPSGNPIGLFSDVQIAEAPAKTQG